MDVTLFSFIMAIIWFNAFVLLFAVLRRRTEFLLKFSLWPLIAIGFAAILRLVVFFDFPFTVVVPSFRLLPAVFSFLNFEIIKTTKISISILTILRLLWITVAFILLARLYISIIKNYRCMKQLDSVYDERIDGLMDSIAGPKLKYNLIISRQISIPAVVGFFKPYILLPSCVASFSDQAILNILRHELQHFLHRDQWLKLFINILCVALWWNPIVHLLRKELDQTLEINCDMKLTSNMSDVEKINYSESMVEILKQSDRNKSFENSAFTYSTGFAVFTKGENLKQRLYIIMSNTNTERIKTKWLSLLVMVPLLILSFSFIIQPRFSPPDNDLADAMELTSENSYIEANEDGTYSLFVNGALLYTFTDEQTLNEMASTIQIIDEGG